MVGYHKKFFERPFYHNNPERNMKPGFGALGRYVSINLVWQGVTLVVEATQWEGFLFCRPTLPGNRKSGEILSAALSKPILVSYYFGHILFPSKPIFASREKLIFAFFGSFPIRLFLSHSSSPTCRARSYISDLAEVKNRTEARQKCSTKGEPRHFVYSLEARGSSLLGQA